MKPLGIAFIGYGSIGRVHAMGYRSLPFLYGLDHDAVRIIGAATAHAESAQAAARELGCDVWSDDYRVPLEREDVDVVDICTPNAAHLQPVLDAAAAGKHIYCEKPLGLTVTEARRMVDAVERAGVKHQVTFHNRFVPAVLRARQLLDQGFVGDVFSFQSRYHRSSYVDPNKPISWKLRMETSGGGALVDLGAHALDLLRYLLGDVTAVRATLRTLIPQRPAAPGSSQLVPVDVDDFALLELRMASGAFGTMEASRVATGATNDMGFEIYGSKGALRYNFADPNWLYAYSLDAAGAPISGQRGFTRIETIQRYPGAHSPDWTAPTGFVRAHAECQYRFLRAIWDDNAPAPDMVDGLRVQEIMAAAQRSDEEQRWVALT